MTNDITKMIEEIECVRLEKAQGEPNARPPFFDERYVLPIHGQNLILQIRNKHERDDHIVFHEEPHIYAIDGLPAGTSVSSLAHEYEEPFDSILGIRAMQKSQKESWPRLSYVHGAKKVTLEELDVKKGCLLYNTTDKITIASMNPDNTRTCTPLHIYNLLKSTCKKLVNEISIEIYNFEQGMTDDDIKRKWEAHGMDARNRGTEAHLQMELWFNSIPCRYDDPEVEVGIRFIHKCLLPIQAKAFRTEWEIFAEEEDVAGCIDLAVILPDGSIFLIDWKRSEKLPTKMKGYKKMKAPLDNLDDCSGCSYALQLSAYQYIIEKYYNLKVSGRALVSLHPSTPFTTKVPYLPEIEYIMLKRRLQTNTRKRLEIEGNNDDLKCCITQRIVERGVRDEHGKLYWEKSALLHNIPNTQLCEETTKRAMTLLETETPHASELTEKIPWRSRFPKAWWDE